MLEHASRGRGLEQRRTEQRGQGDGAQTLRGLAEKGPACVRAERDQASIMVRSSNLAVRFANVPYGWDPVRPETSRFLFQARIPRMTVALSTPVSLASRPWNLTLKASWSMPSWWSIVACRSCTVQTFSTAA